MIWRRLAAGAVFTFVYSQPSLPEGFLFKRSAGGSGTAQAAQPSHTPEQGLSYLDQIVQRARQLLDGNPSDPVLAASLLGEAAKAGNVPAMGLLASLYANGKGVPVDFNMARALLEESIAAGAGEDGWRALGDLYNNADEPYRDAVKAATTYQKAADLGDSWSMISLGRMYGSGDGVPLDTERAKALFRSAAAVGGDSAQWAWVSFGDLYQGAVDARIDSKQAVEAYQKAISLGNTRAMISLAKMLGSGDGVQVDFDTAKSLLETAIAAGSGAEASMALGDLFSNADTPHRDSAQAAKAYQAAADLGDPWAMIDLGRMYGSGEGVPLDAERAITMYESAVAVGGDSAQWAWRDLGDFYRNGNPRDPAKAADAYRKAADLGNPESMISLAQMLSSGDGSPVDFNMAKAFLEKAIATGSAVDGWKALGELYSNAEAPHRDPAQAAKAYQLAVDLGDPWAMIDLGRMYGSGDGVPLDIERAKGMFDSAVAVGGDSAQFAWKNIGDLYRNGNLREPAKAAQAYRKAIELGNPESMISLAQMLGSGDGVPADFNNARTLLEDAIGAGRGADAAMVLGDLYRTHPESGDPALALEAYERAAEEGNGDAHLAAGLLMSADLNRAEARAAMARHFQQAAALSGPDEVARTMFGLKPEALYVAVQEFLIGVGQDPGRPDGVNGKKTRQAIDAYCSIKKIESCDGSFVTLALLNELLQDAGASSEKR